MWASGEDTNDDGIPVRLYQPILYSGRASNVAADPTFSHVGGIPSYFESDAAVNVNTPQCACCNQEMPLLLQLHIPSQQQVSRTLYVFGCNQGSCVSSIFETSKFSLGGDGVFVCKRSQPGSGADSAATRTTIAESTSPWATDEKGNTENDWDVTDADSNLEDMEAMVAAMEMDESKGKVERTKQKRPASKGSNDADSGKTPEFSCFEIHSLQEPTTVKDHDMDDDDVGMVGGSDAKIQQMLARYMAEEEDEDILAAIRGAGGTGGGGGRGERDERLSADDRALLTFTDRVKRVPRQIVRYARGGIPLFSM